MSTIAANAPYVTLINVFIVEPDKAEELAEFLDRATEEVMQYVPGFISANIHVADDRSRVVNYAQWASTDAYSAMLADGAARQHMGHAAALAISFDPHLYTVGSVHERREAPAQR